MPYRLHIPKRTTKLDDEILAKTNSILQFFEKELQIQNKYTNKLDRISFLMLWIDLNSHIHYISQLLEYSGADHWICYSQLVIKTPEKQHQQFIEPD